MRKTALAGLFVFAIIAAGSSSSSAHAQDILQIDQLTAYNAEPKTILASLEVIKTEPEVRQTPAEPATVKYKVVKGDSLSKIAKAHNTTWDRLFNKNVSLENPDILAVGAELTIPAPDEVLAVRPLPAPDAPKQTSTNRTSRTTRTSRNSTASRPRSHSPGNTYTAGYCTWYAKSRRPDLPNNLGNANTWSARARAQGIPTGSAPRAGAIGQRGMHVVYVESVNADGSVTISEMNHVGVFVKTVRTLPASYFTYIY